MWDEWIWDEWKKHSRTCGIDESRICRDGIVSPYVFNQEKYKVLFIGKEVNNWEGGDMTVLAYNGPKHIYLYNLARWATGLLENFPYFKTINKWKHLNSSLRRISLINLKKTSGGSSSNPSVISAYAKNDKDLLLKQIELIKPNIIFALSTHDILIWLLDLAVSSDSPNNSPYYCKNNDIWIIPWKHASLRGNIEKHYNELKIFVHKSTDFVSFLNS